MNLKQTAIKTGIIIILVLALSAVFFLIQNNNGQNIAADKDNNSEGLSLPPRTNNEEGLEIEAQPIDFSFDKPLQIKLSFNTHQGDLNFDLIKQAKIIDDRNREYLPLEWQGSMGGHHLSGILVFPSLPENVKKITLSLFNIYNVNERQFFWDL